MTSRGRGDRVKGSMLEGEVQEKSADTVQAREKKSMIPGIGRSPSAFPAGSTTPKMGGKTNT